MKKLITIITVFLAVTTQATAQQFETTDTYFVSLASTLNQDGEEVQTALLNAKGDEQADVTSFPIADASLIHDVQVTKLNNPGLSGVKSVVKVNVQYVEYCSYVVSNYILVTENDGFITLPILTNEDCGDSDKAFVYLFPNQSFGEVNQILTSQVTVQEKNILEAEQHDTFIWNDDSYGTSGALYEEL